MENSAIELDINSIFSNIREVTHTVGEKWLLKKVKEEEDKNKSRQKNINNRKHSYLYEVEPHQLIQWTMDIERWRKSCLETKRFELNESVLKYAILGKALSRAKHQKGFEKLKSRLKMKSEFYSAAFEAEVASSYIQRGWKVEFVEEGNERSPDLKVIRQDGSVFWVECKCRDALTERDSKINSFWTELESSLLRYMGPNKINGAVFIKSLSDPERSDLEPLKQFIFEQLKSAEPEKMAGKEIRSTFDPTRKYQVAVHRLLEADVEVESGGIGFNASEDFDKVSMFAEMKVDENKKAYVRNPMVLAFQNAILSDKVTGIINGFNTAVGQLPESGPGVVWIRIPDNAWNKDLQNSFSKAQKIIKSELSGEHNRRVNAVILMTRIFEKKEKNGTEGIGYKPLMTTIEHDNPRSVVI